VYFISEIFLNLRQKCKSALWMRQQDICQGQHYWKNTLTAVGMEVLGSEPPEHGSNAKPLYLVFTGLFYFSAKTKEYLRSSLWYLNQVLLLHYWMTCCFVVWNNNVSTVWILFNNWTVITNAKIWQKSLFSSPHPTPLLPRN
jgi:hypothetical protein